MTKAEALEKLIFIFEVEDTEIGHLRADEVLCDLLRSLDCDAVVDAFEKIDKWYS